MDSATPVYRLLVPLNFNDGSEVPSELHDALEDELYVAFGGCTVGGTVRGSYRMENGDKQVDHLVQMWVAVPDEQWQELEEIIQRYCERFQQECMYLEKTGATAQLIRPKRN